jgi:hypothetical protein
MGNYSSQWSNPCNWTPIVVPTSLTPVVISNNGMDPIVPNGSSLTIKSLEIQTGAKLTLQGNGTIIVQQD